jgi:Response regulator of the LytR/AlgR family
LLYKTAIIDDSIVFSTFLKSVLTESPHVKSVDLYPSAEDFLSAGHCRNHQLLFVDIGLPAQSGIDLVKTLNSLSPNAHTVFITGHPEFAPDAVQLKVSHYLLKPISKERILETINKIHETPNGGPEPSAPPGAGKILLRTGRDLRLINQEDIIFIEKQGKKCLIYTTSGAITAAGSLESFEKSLAHSFFYKSHRGFIINVNMVFRTEKWSDRAYKIKMHHTTGEPLLSRAKFKNLESMLRIFQK